MEVISYGRRGIWKSWRATLGVLRIVTDVSYVSRINHESDFLGFNPESDLTWQGQYLVTLEDDFCSSALCKQPFICDKDE